LFGLFIEENVHFYLNSFFHVLLSYQTSMIPETDKLNHTKKQMLAMIDVAMGGRAAEDVFIGND